MRVRLQHIVPGRHVKDPGSKDSTPHLAAKPGGGGHVGVSPAVDVL